MWDSRRFFFHFPWKNSPRNWSQGGELLGTKISASLSQVAKAYTSRWCFNIPKTGTCFPFSMIFGTPEQVPSWLAKSSQTNNKQQTTNKKQQTSTNKQPTNINKQTTNSKQPTNNQRETTNINKQTANNQQPTTNNQQEEKRNNQQPTRRKKKQQTNNKKKKETTNKQQTNNRGKHITSTLKHLVKSWGSTSPAFQQKFSVTGGRWGWWREGNPRTYEPKKKWVPPVWVSFHSG